MTARELAKHCDRAALLNEPTALCAFVIVEEIYGTLSGLAGYCQTHDGGTISIGMAVRDHPTKASRQRDERAAENARYR